jgi:hypothetical protein
MKKYRISIMISIFAMVAITCEKTGDDNDDQNYMPGDTCTTNSCYAIVADSIYKRMMEAYNSNCIPCLEQVLIDWDKTYDMNPEIPDSVQDIYTVYKEIYSPWDLARISESEFGDDIYQGISYYVIQSEIQYNYDFRGYSANYNMISNFRPAVANDTIHLLYLSISYELALDFFLGSDYLPKGFEGYQKPAIGTDETYRRYEFLSNFLMFFHGHWGNYWHLETHPEVEFIAFNQSEDSAQVCFRLGYQWGEVILGKENSNWVISEHYMTMIE